MRLVLLEQRGCKVSKALRVLRALLVLWAQVVLTAVLGLLVALAIEELLARQDRRGSGVRPGPPGRLDLLGRPARPAPMERRVPTGPRAIPARPVPSARPARRDHKAT